MDNEKLQRSLKELGVVFLISNIMLGYATTLDELKEVLYTGDVAYKDKEGY